MTTPPLRAPRGLVLGRRLLVAAGVLVMAFAVVGSLGDRDVNKVGVPLFLVALVVLHDGVFLPLVLAAGALIGRIVPAGWRPAVRAPGLVSLALTVVALPLVLGFGRDPRDPSALPLPYPRNLAVILGLVWVVSLAARKTFARRPGRRTR